MTSCFGAAQTGTSTPSLSPFSQAPDSPALVQLQQFKPIYFLMGTPDTKVQFSFKGQLVRTVPFYFAYTQLMMWDLFKSGAPIRDVNFNPELFYRLYLENHLKSIGVQLIDLGLFEHESNGKGGTSAERSWNRTSITLKSGTNYFRWSFKIWYPYAFNPNSQNLPQYRGIWELNLSLLRFLGPFFETHELAFRLYPGGVTFNNPFLGGQEVTLTAQLALKPLMTSLVIQIFHGYGENLLNENDERFALRVGIGF